ncbi:MAG TPA: hypothetical protein VGC08_03710, partial [Pedobacter sp.]
MNLKFYLKSFFCFVLAISFTAFISRAQQIRRIDGTKISADSLSKYIPELMRKAKVPGLGIVVFNGNHAVYKKTFGYSRADK